MDLILPVRVRTCAEDVGRTGECGKGSFGEEPGRTSNGRDGEASQRYFAGRRVGLREVRASTLWVKHAVEPRLGPPEGVHTVTLSGSLGAWRGHAQKNGDSFRPDEVPRRLRSMSGASVIYKAMPKGHVTRRICEAGLRLYRLMGWQQSVSSFRLYEESETRNRFK
jgi:hypothetical protein